MQNSWLDRPQVHYRGEGLRPSFARIMEIVDVNDPALAQIAVALQEAREPGTELDDDAVAEAVRIGRQRWADREEPQPETERIAPSFESIVYYIQRGPLVKIGTTRRPESRFLTLLPDKILAVEPGDRSDERQRHVQFRHLRQGTSEYFKQDENLIRHIEAVRAEHGAPNPSWPTVATLDRPRLDFHMDAPAANSPEVVTASEGADRLGVPRNTVHGWVYRGRLRPVGKGEKGRSVYFLDDMKFLTRRSTAMTEARVIRIP